MWLHVVNYLFVWSIDGYAFIFSYLLRMPYLIDGIEGPQLPTIVAVLRHARRSTNQERVAQYALFTLFISEHAPTSSDAQAYNRALGFQHQASN